MLFNVGATLAAAAMPVTAAVLVAATGRGSLRGNRFLPYGLDWASLGLTVALLVILINFVAVIGLFAWVLLLVGLMIAGRLPFEEGAPTRGQ